MSGEQPRLLVLTSTFPRWQGDKIPAFVYELCQQLQHKFSVTVLAPHSEGASRDEWMGRVRVLRYRYAMAAMEKLAYDGGMTLNVRRRPWLLLSVPSFLLCQFVAALSFVNRTECRLIHAHWVIPQGIVAVIVKMVLRSKVRIIITAHGSDLLTLNKGLLSSIKARILRRCDFITVVSEHLRQRCLELGVKPDNVCVLPMGVDVTNTFVPLRKSKTQSKKLVFVGRLVPQKGVSILLRAFKRLLQSFPSAELAIVGDGPEKEVLISVCAQLGIEKQVSFKGWCSRPQVAAQLREADIAVVPSTMNEGFGLVVVEAMACGCAVIASDYPSFRQLLKPCGGDVLFEPGNVEALFQALERLCNQDAELARVKEIVRKLAVTRYGWDVIGSGYLQLLGQLVMSQQQ